MTKTHNKNSKIFLQWIQQHHRRPADITSPKTTPKKKISSDIKFNPSNAKTKKWVLILVAMNIKMNRE